MRDRGYGAPVVTALALVICVPAIAALVIALAGLRASVPPPLPVLLIKCATAFDARPCGPDPAMRRLLEIPQPVPFNAPVQPLELGPR